MPITPILAASPIKSLSRAYARQEFGILLIYFTLYISAIVIASLTFWRRAWILLLSGIAMGFLFEFFGTRIGLPFGLYYYQELRPQVRGRKDTEPKPHRLPTSHGSRHPRGGKTDLCRGFI
ncbi:MAG: hypothetical protein DRO00_02585 [Thermoproteota archaeon]|nr:MAG: hypothetical protein DRO00_02585 [Candidatus Korarchaeota archaeon]